MCRFTFPHWSISSNREHPQALQFQSETLQSPVIRPKQLETTALGAAYLAGLAVGYWDSVDDIQSQWIVDKEFYPKSR